MNGMNHGGHGEYLWRDNRDDLHQYRFPVIPVVNNQY
jgi:hypothetical protein